jgi:hypothetical protein
MTREFPNPKLANPEEAPKTKPQHFVAGAGRKNLRLIPRGSTWFHLIPRMESKKETAHPRAIESSETMATRCGFRDFFPKPLTVLERRTVFHGFRAGGERRVGVPEYRRIGDGKGGPKLAAVRLCSALLAVARLSGGRSSKSASAKLQRSSKCQAPTNRGPLAVRRSGGVLVFEPTRRRSTGTSLPSHSPTKCYGRDMAAIWCGIGGYWVRTREDFMRFGRDGCLHGEAAFTNIG